MAFAHQREHRREAPEPEPPREPDELDDVVGDRPMNAFSLNVRGLLRGANTSSMSLATPLEHRRVLDLDVELRDHPELVAPGELDELERRVRDVLVLRVVGSDPPRRTP